MTKEQKKKVSFKDGNNRLFDIEIELSTDNNGKQRFSMSGDSGEGSGQIIDKIKPANQPQKELVELWENYHLNDTNAGTEKQEQKLKEKQDRVGDYTEQCDFLFSFDHDGKPIPAYKTKKIEQDISRLNKNIEKLQDEIKNLDEAEKKYKPEAKKTGVWVNIPELDIKEFAERDYKLKKIINRERNKRQDRINELREELEKVKSQTLLYDYLEDGTLYKYGSGHIYKPLPDKIWEQVENIVNRINELETKNRFKGGSWDDISDYKIVALGKSLGLDPAEAQHNITKHSRELYDYCGRQYWVLTDDEAHIMAEDRLEEHWQEAVDNGDTELGKDDWLQYVIDNDSFGSILNSYDGTEEYDDDNEVYIIRAD